MIYTVNRGSIISLPIWPTVRRRKEPISARGPLPLWSNYMTPTSYSDVINRVHSSDCKNKVIFSESRSVYCAVPPVQWYFFRGPVRISMILGVVLLGGRYKEFHTPHMICLKRMKFLFYESDLSLFQFHFRKSLRFDWQPLWPWITHSIPNLQILHLHHYFVLFADRSADFMKLEISF